MYKKLMLAAALLAASTLSAVAAEPMTDKAMCEARLKTHQEMLKTSDAGKKAEGLVVNLLTVFEHLCETEDFDEALLVGNTIRGLLATEN